MIFYNYIFAIETTQHKGVWLRNPVEDFIGLYIIIIISKLQIGGRSWRSIRDCWDLVLV